MYIAHALRVHTLHYKMKFELSVEKNRKKRLNRATIVQFFLFQFSDSLTSFYTPFYNRMTIGHLYKKIVFYITSLSKHKALDRPITVKWHKWDVWTLCREIIKCLYQHITTTICKGRDVAYRIKLGG